MHPGRVRVLPLNAAFCFPEWHPHDRSRLIRFKLKYRFWGTSAEGTRQVYTYTEVITDDAIEEYVNDELVDSRPNPIGTIPVVHISNTPVSGSPWGLSDVGDIVSLNRTYNEIWTDILDIVNYHAAPVTIITGAKASNLEKGPKKVWGGLPKDANVFNLENGVNLAGPIEAADQIKRSMHEITGVPESALGQMQPISNTSGVALAIMYQPMMQRYNLKKLQYGVGLKRINELILRTLFCFEPNAVFYDPNTQGIMQPGQEPEINPADPLVYETDIDWAPPLPVDALIKLQEIQQKMLLGLESKRGALKDLGEPFPDEKVQEIFEEMVQDAKEEGALNMLKAQISSAILQMTGMSPDDGMEAPGAGQTDADGNPVQEIGGPAPINAQGMDFLNSASGGQAEMMTELVTQAYGTKLGSRRNPNNEND